MNTNTLTLDQKFAKLLLDFKKIRPFYSALYSCIDKVEDNSIETACTNGLCIKYNHDFMDKLPYSEFIFVIMHELAHITLMHVSRSRGKDLRLWNAAADFMVNALLAEEIHMVSSTRTGTINNVTVKMPDNVLYSENVDTDKDSVEQIYDYLMQQAKNNGYNAGGMGAFSINSDDANEQSSSDQSTQAGGKSNNNNSSSGDFELSSSDETDIRDEGKDKQMQEFEEKRILNNVNNKMKMQGLDSSDCKLHKYVNELLKSKLDWKKLLRKYCIELKNCDTSFSNPDKRMFYQSAIYPSQSPENLNALKDIKFAFDTSGSMSEEEFKYIVGQILDITKRYKVSGEAICWDTQVNDVVNVDNFLDFSKFDFQGGYGTDVNCLFRYLESKKCRVKPRVLLIFTDGYLTTRSIPDKVKRKYKDTIWVMSKNYNTSFEPGFGRMAIAKFE